MSTTFDWEWESFEGILGNGSFSISDPGPLSVPIRAFSFGRNEDLRLILATQADQDAKTSAPTYPAGTVRINTDTVIFTNHVGIKMVAHGVDRRHFNRSILGHPALGELKEEWLVHRLDGVVEESKEPAYVIEWLANLSDAYHWPDNSDETTEIIKTLKLSGSPEGRTLKSSGKGSSLRRNCARLNVGGQEMYLCSSADVALEKAKKPGFILYIGNPPPDVREKIRNCLSFALGEFLVYLGSSSFCADCKLISFEAVSPYTLGGAAFRLPTMPPSPLGTQYEWEINAAILNRFAEAILTAYTSLKFRSLSWAYWHALCATPHIAPVHFGAAIEAVQRRYVRANTRVDTSLLGADDWKILKDAAEAAIPRLSAREDTKAILGRKVFDLNKAPQNLVNERVIAALGITLSETEKKAWTHRNVAAHGTETDDDGAIELIREIKLLRIIFHRMVLAITKASDSYYDYFSLDRPVRQVAQPVP